MWECSACGDVVHVGLFCGVLWAHTRIASLPSIDVPLSCYLSAYFVDTFLSSFYFPDIGEHSYTAVLAHAVTDMGSIDLLVTTMAGNVLLFRTESPYHPYKAWPKQVQGLNGFSSGIQGICIVDSKQGVGM